MPTGEVGAIRGAASGEDPWSSLDRGWAVRTDPGAWAWHGWEETKHLEKCEGRHTHGISKGPIPEYLKQTFPKGGMLAGLGADAHLHACSLARWV